MNDSHNVDGLIRLLGASRSDPRIDSFIRQVDPPPVITVDKEDDADAEFVEFKAHGFGLAFDHDILRAVDLRSGQQADGYARYELPLPMGISFQQSRSEVQALLPPPDVEGGGREGYFGPIPEWIRYDNVDGLAIHFEFTSDAQAVQMVTLMFLRNYEANKRMHQTPDGAGDP